MEEHDRRRDGKNVFTWQVETEMKTATVMISARHDMTVQALGHGQTDGYTSLP